MSLWAITLALIVLGIGWNFLAVSSSSLLTQASLPQEKAKTQAVSDFLTLFTTTLTAFSSAPLHHRYGWSLVNFSVVPALAAVVLLTNWLRNIRLSGGSHDIPQSSQDDMRSIARHFRSPDERRYGD
jgi:hypothetical protein